MFWHFTIRLVHWCSVYFAEENKYWNGCGTTVPQNAANAKVFVWKNNTLAPLMTPILLKN